MTNLNLTAEIFVAHDCVDEADAWYKRGDVYANLGWYKQALASFDRALTLRPDCCKSLVSRGAVLVMLGRYPEALVSCDKALEFQPNDEETWVIRAAALHGLGRYKECYRCCDRALGIERKSLWQKLVDLTTRCCAKLKIPSF
ncbi:tetratricopeptide repeat protein [Scytonema sp. UIC 10036]|uniref:tetratricopeptide repeat protein n=1 Tax=Scytonema sp. UIC 10036 TaxID=2304196 RepID=UPI0012DAABF1|nr:tetratricopeptide repeat protein [Scytonema sp. UIC 10036]MUG94064.1 tetratricopeptide repeat protein [Scytonema sp. UIC 10036]